MGCLIPGEDLEFVEFGVCLGTAWLLSSLLLGS